MGGCRRFIRTLLSERGIVARRETATEDRDRMDTATVAAIMAEEDRTAEEDLAQTVVRETETEAVAAMVTAVATRPADWIVRSTV